MSNSHVLKRLRLPARVTKEWRIEARGRIASLRNEDLDDLEQQIKPPTAKIARLQDELNSIESTLPTSGPDEIWPRLHRVEERIAGLAQGQLLMSYVLWAVGHRSDPALADHKTFEDGHAWKHLVQIANDGKLPANIDGLADEVRSVLHQAHMAIDEHHLDANDCHKRLRWASAGLWMLSLLVVVAAVALNDLPFLVGAENFKDVPDIQLAFLVAVGGLVGGAWGAVPAFIGTRRDLYRLQYVRAGTRLALGVLAALIGVSLVGAGWVAGLTGDSAPALFAIAIAFGLTQEPVTKILENKLGRAVAHSSE